MSYLESHHDVAIMLLVGRSLPQGIPWTLEQDQQNIDRERALWELLSPEEQLWEQQFLAGLWRTPLEQRILQVNPEWGDWTSEVPNQVTILPEAFGMPHKAYRPDPRGPQGEGAWASWLWKMGFQVVQQSVVSDLDSRASRYDEFTLSIPATRVLQEADRLVTLLQRDFPASELRPWGDADGGFQAKSSYDPIQKRTYLSFRTVFSSIPTIR